LVLHTAQRNASSFPFTVSIIFGSVKLMFNNTIIQKQSCLQACGLWPQASVMEQNQKLIGF
jgi:hypothetical protein